MNTKKVTVGSLLFLLIFIGACSNDDQDGTDPAVFDDSPYTLVYEGVEDPNLNPDNPLTIEGVKLGRMLFYDARLSKDGSQSCASCHRQEHAFTDTARFSIGVEGLKGKRQAMSVFNTAWHSNEFFWDGRAHLLRDQAVLPIQDPLEMNESLSNVIDKLKASEGYRNQFIRAFGSEDIDADRIALALEQFMNSIVSFSSKYDRYLKGELSLSASEERGRVLFFAEFNPGFPNTSGADCAHCHSGSTFENDRYMNNGLSADGDYQDSGRYNVSLNPRDIGSFKVTTLRNIELTAPYMHDGSLSTLEEVIDHYNNGLEASVNLDPALEYTRVTGGLKLSSQDKADLIAFLKTLTDQELINDPRYSDPF
ncbi:MAG: cytochrome-c peroxidase [Croceimicrobium sp.]